MLKPWGFAPRNGHSSKSNDEIGEYSAAADPCYSAVPDRKMKPVIGFARVSYDSRPDCSLIVVNRGPDDGGFEICDRCGAAYPSTAVEMSKNLYPPYPRDEKGNLPTCNHHFRHGILLGDTFRSDLVLFEFRLSQDEVCVQGTIGDTIENHWLTRAVTSLTEAVHLAAADLLDVGFAELNTGHRTRASRGNEVFVDIYLFDSLTSGAGYSSQLTEPKAMKALFMKTRDILEGCTCEKACFKCLMHYGNKRVHSLLDRYAALSLLDYVTLDEAQHELSDSEKRYCLNPLKNALEMSGMPVAMTDAGTLQVQAGKGRRITIEAVPDCSVEFNGRPRYKIWKHSLLYDIPMVFEEIRNALDAI